MEPLTLFTLFHVFVIDGDTFVYHGVKFRLYGVNAPERGMPCYEEAREALKEFFERGAQAITVGEDRFGRRLVLVWNSRGSAASWLFSKGLAIPYPYAGPLVAKGYLADALAKWRPGCLFKVGRTLVELVTFTYNPPGPDKEEIVLKNKSFKTVTVTLMNKRWSSVVVEVGPGVQTVTVTNFLGNKGDALVVHVKGTLQALVAYIPKAFTSTVYPGGTWSPPLDSSSR
ncbi:thermonuclease family protein [Ignicoccus hospitalis]|uniref:Nuclease (SNase domain protein) n=1 Tax=Ignicoccus hospitalis (strain KIN4/I / DSM 18386 / JCM 14125) TaxID=453591 RepID=A8AC67_IGNH4|nr:thermonuclease family protein [Ignicoccus hospitalis]ABU82519.1 nuclease (SNase domain protein) [Ignicoccus hospitalis KIN4/I]HIH90682.1 thermonuclease family protein [Desulfurococcaceae archaeon]